MVYFYIISTSIYGIRKNITSLFYMKLHISKTQFLYVTHQSGKYILENLLLIDLLFCISLVRLFAFYYGNIGLMLNRMHVHFVLLLKLLSHDIKSCVIFLSLKIFSNHPCLIMKDFISNGSWCFIFISKWGYETLPIYFTNNYYFQNLV